LEGELQYDPVGDSLVGIAGLRSDTISGLETVAAGLADTAARLNFWSDVVRVVHFGAGLYNLPSADLEELRQAIESSDSNLSFSTVMTEVLGLNPLGEIIEGTDTADVLIGGM